MMRGSDATLSSYIQGDELRSIDPMRHDITDSTVNGFDVLGLTFEGRLHLNRSSLFLLLSPHRDTLCVLLCCILCERA